MNARDIAFLAEIHQGQLAPITFELLTAAKELAAQTGGKVIAYLLHWQFLPSAASKTKAQGEKVTVYTFGDKLDNLVGQLSGADLILSTEDPALASFTPGPFLTMLEHFVRTGQPRVLLLGSTTIGLDLATPLSARLGAPVVIGCKQIRAEGEHLDVVSQLYAGKMMADVRVSGTPVIAAVLPGCYREWRESGNAKVEMQAPPGVLETGAVTFKEMIVPKAGDVDITQQDLLVSVGRGIQQKENIELAEELAQALGGAVSSSRPVVDQSWLPQTRQVGKSGMTVKPKCYLALGISGAPEHQEGMKNSPLIIAVNTDPKAPIFDIAQYGAVVDILDLIPALTEKAKAKGVAV